MSKPFLRAEPERTIRLAGKDLSASWQGVRHLTSMALSLGATRRDLEAITEPLGEREAVRWICGAFPESREPSGPAEERCLDLTSHLTHNWIPKRPLLEDLASTLSRLLEGRIHRIVVPCLASVDFESMSALKALYRQPDLPRPELWVSLDAGTNGEAPDSRGVIWSMPPELLRPLERSFRNTGEQGGGGAAPGSDPCLAVPVLESLPPDASDRERLMLVRRLFQVYGFTGALRAGLDLLDRKPDFLPAELAELHHRVGLAAHNRQFHSTADKRLESFLERSFQRAFELDPDPGRKAALCYRLAVVTGRRMGRLTEAAEWAERGLELAATLPAADRAYQMAWCHNIRSYLSARQGDLAGAFADTEAAFFLLEPHLEARTARPAAQRTACDLDFLATGQLLADHCVTLSILVGDLSRGKPWLERAERFLATFPAAEHLDGLLFLDFQRATGDARDALARAESARRSAASELDFSRELQLTLESAGFAERLGDPGRAAGLLQRGCELQRQLGLSPGEVRLDVLEAAALLRAGRPVEATQRISEALEDPRLSAAEEQAELLGVAAGCAAALGDFRAAEARINEAIEAAVAGGRELTLARTALTAGEVALSLGDELAAREAFDRAGELLGPPEKGGTVAPGEWVRLLSGRWRAGVRAPSELAPWTQAAVRRAARALRQPEIWAFVEPWLQAAEACGLAEYGEDPQIEIGLRQLAKARAEREAYRGGLDRPSG